MSCRVVIFAVTALALATVLQASDELRCAQEANATSVSQVDELSALFDTPSDVLVTPSGMMVVSPQIRTWMLVKRADDGTLVTACVTNAKDADEFLHSKTPTSAPRVRTEK